jgi:hypothetical protein
MFHRDIDQQTRCNSAKSWKVLKTCGLSHSHKLRAIVVMHLSAEPWRLKTITATLLLFQPKIQTVWAMTMG